MIDLPVCDICQDKEKPSLSKAPGDVWLCDDCIANREHYEAFENDIRESKPASPGGIIYINGRKAHSNE